MKIKVDGNLSDQREFYPILYPESEQEVNLLQELNFEDSINIEEFVNKVSNLKVRSKNE